MTLKSYKIVCIIMIIVGVLGVASNISSLSGSGASILGVILGLLYSICMFVAGFIGNKAAKDGDTDKAPLCRKISYGLLAFAVINVVASIIQATQASQMAVPGLPSSIIPTMAVVIGIVSLILPILYLLGAKKLDQ